MKLKNFLLGSLCMIATTASAQFTGTGYYVVKSNSGKYLSVEGNTAERVDGYFKDLKLNDEVNNRCIMYIDGDAQRTITLSGVKYIKPSITNITVGNISALDVIAKATNLGQDAAFELVPITEKKLTTNGYVDVPTGQYKMRGYNSAAEVYLKENNGNVGTRGGENSDLWEIIPYEEIGNALTGDANGDGEVKCSDLKVLRDYIVKKISLDDISIVNADADKNGIIDGNDLNKIKEILLNQ